MKSWFLCVLLISAALLVRETDAECLEVCFRVCVRVEWILGSGSDGEICVEYHLNCEHDCKRAIEDQERLPLPWKFSDYDSNGDGKVTLAEFAKGAQVDKKSCVKAFMFADANDDGSLTPQELHEGPFLFDIEDN